MAPEPEKTQVEEDAFQAWTYAANCLLYEADPGSAQVNVGTAKEPVLVSKEEAWQITYAREVLVKLDADLGRLQAAGLLCHRTAAEKQGERPKYAREEARAADLCERAAQMVIDSGGASSDKARRRLLAVAEHDGMMATLGMVPAAAKAARQDLKAKLREIDKEPDPLKGVPSRLPYRGATYDPATGRFQLGQGAEGHLAYWTLHTPGIGMENGLVVGPEQIGKSSVLRLVLVEAIQAGRFVLWTADPSGRGELPGPVEAAVDQSAGSPKETLELLRAASAIVEHRLAQGGYADPAAGKPGLLLAIENCHRLFADDLEATELAERIAVTGGPAGVGMVVTAPGIDPDCFGGSLALRAALAKRNGLPMGPDALRMANELHPPR